MKQLLFILLITSAGIAGKAQTNYERDSVALSSAFQTRVRISSIAAAKDVLANTGQAQYLVNYCQIIISNPFGEGWLDALSYAVASAPAITLEATDSDIQFTINSNLEKYAAAYYKIIP
jgi:hypothetical protein